MELNRVILGTENKEKCETIKKMLKKYNIHYKKIICMQSDSKVDGSPENNETVRGARNRITSLLKDIKPEINDLYVGLESGLFKLYDKKWYEKCICCIKYFKSLDEPIIIYAGSEEYPLCEMLNELLDSGKRHREGMSTLRKQKNIPSDVKDTFAIYTNNEKKRIITFEQSFSNCLLKLKYY